MCAFLRAWIEKDKHHGGCFRWRTITSWSMWIGTWCLRGPDNCLIVQVKVLFSKYENYHRVPCWSTYNFLYKNIVFLAYFYRSFYFYLPLIKLNPKVMLKNANKKTKNNLTNWTTLITFANDIKFLINQLQHLKPWFILIHLTNEF